MKHWFHRLEHVAQAYHVPRDAGINIMGEAKPVAAALEGKTLATPLYELTDRLLEWLTDLHRSLNGPYLVLCASMGSLLPPKLPTGVPDQFKRWTDLYICLCLRKVALDLGMSHPSDVCSMPLFAFFDSDFDLATVRFLQDQHFVALADNFVYSDYAKLGIERGVNEGVTAIVQMVSSRSPDYRRSATVSAGFLIAARSHRTSLDLVGARDCAPRHQGSTNRCFHSAVAHVGPEGSLQIPRARPRLVS
jgi:hypothetical protein